MHLAHDRLVLNEGAEGGAGRVLEEHEQHDPQQDHQRVLLDPTAEPEDLGEDEVEDPEQRQWPQDRPDVAQHRCPVLEPVLLR